MAAQKHNTEYVPPEDLKGYHVNQEWGVHRIVMPLPPSVNIMYRQFRGRTLLSKYGRTFKDFWTRYFLNAKPIKEDQLHANYTFWLPDHRPRDLDNFFKCANDLLEAIFGFNDSRIVSIRANKQVWPGSSVMAVTLYKHQVRREPPPVADKGYPVTLRATGTQKLTEGDE